MGGPYVYQLISKKDAAQVIVLIKHLFPDLRWIVDLNGAFNSNTKLSVSKLSGKELVEKGLDYISARPKGLVETKAGRIGPAVVTLDKLKDCYCLTVHNYKDTPTDKLHKYVSPWKVDQLQKYTETAYDALDSVPEFKK